MTDKIINSRDATCGTLPTDDAERGKLALELWRRLFADDGIADWFDCFTQARALVTGDTNAQR